MAILIVFVNYKTCFEDRYWIRICMVSSNLRTEYIFLIGSHARTHIYIYIYIHIHTHKQTHLSAVEYFFPFITFLNTYFYISIANVKSVNWNWYTLSLLIIKTTVLKLQLEVLCFWFFKLYHSEFRLVSAPMMMTMKGKMSCHQTLTTLWPMM
jgi:hypothetical protein